MRRRKSVNDLSSQERQNLVQAFLTLKKNGRYDQYVHWHHHVMDPSVLPHEPRDPNYRNGAHRGPSFFPWHRAFLQRVELDLQEVDSSVTLPYWDWSVDAALSDPTKAPIWSDELMGGNGVKLEGKDDEDPENWHVATGAFAYAAGNWPIPVEMDGPALRRQFGVMLPTLPTNEDVTLAMNEALYDTPNYNSSPFTLGFRNRIEGWVTQRGDSRVKRPGSQLHNRVHLWMGGSMAPMTSPNDPVFFLHHCFIDKLWADWQSRKMKDDPDLAPHYAPIEGGPPGHNLRDELIPFGVTVASVLDVAWLGYAYEPARQTQQAPAMDALTASDFAGAAGHAHHPAGRARRSPFWAD